MIAALLSLTFCTILYLKWRQGRVTKQGNARLICSVIGHKYDKEQTDCGTHYLCPRCGADL